MANNKLHGYTPKTSNETKGNRLDKFNPHEFRTGMDYELTSIGVSRLQESTPEEREKATEDVLKNLEEHKAYYSALIQFEGGMNHGSKITETKFKKFLETYNPGDPGTGMVEVTEDLKDDKMTEPKYNKEEYTIQLKEAIKKEITNILSEAKKDKDEPESEETTDQKASKGAKGKEKALAALDKEIVNLDKERDKNKDKLSAPLQ